jgi:hypothetical protein
VGCIPRGLRKCEGSTENIQEKSVTFPKILVGYFLGFILNFNGRSIGVISQNFVNILKELF